MQKLKVLILAILFLCLNSITQAEIPHLINYQGRLTDSSGAPLNGSYNLTFRIYDAESAGNLLWEEIQTGVVIQKGIFSILLGSVTNLNLPFDKPYFLEIKVGNEVMSPRQQITSAGYAIRAETSEKALDADTVDNIHASTTPQANKLLPLDANAKLPLSSLKVYDSGWFAATANNAYTKTHNLGTTKVLITTMFSANPDGNGITTLGPQMWEYPIGSTPETLMYGLTTTTISFITSSHGVATARDSSNNSTNIINGYMRILIIALE